jgi:hypothetical protein
MIDNNIIFSLIISIVNTVAFYLFTSRDKNNISDHQQEMIMLFGISFSTSFLLKTCVENMIDVKVPTPSGPSMLNSSRPPF